jgi:hypothetical protein
VIQTFIWTDKSAAQKGLCLLRSLGSTSWSTASCFEIGIGLDREKTRIRMVKNPALFSVLWIRIGSDPHHFAGPDRYQFQSNEKVDKLYFFPENFKMLPKILTILTPVTLMRKIKHYKLTML